MEMNEKKEAVEMTNKSDYVYILYAYRSRSGAAGKVRRFEDFADSIGEKDYWEMVAFSGDYDELDSEARNNQAFYDDCTYNYSVIVKTGFNTVYDNNLKHAETGTLYKFDEEKELFYSIASNIRADEEPSMKYSSVFMLDDVMEIKERNYICNRIAGLFDSKDKAEAFLLKRDKEDNDSNRSEFAVIDECPTGIVYPGVCGKGLWMYELEDSGYRQVDYDLYRENGTARIKQIVDYILAPHRF